MLDREAGSLSPGAVRLPSDDEVPFSRSTPARSGPLTDAAIRAAKPGPKPYKLVAAEEVERILAKLVADTKVETARRLHQHCVRLWKYAVKKHYCAHNIMAEIDPIKAAKPKHMPSIEDPRRYGELLRAIEGYGKRAELSTRVLLKALPHVCLRSSEIRWARWSWVNFERAEMRVPAKIMKLPTLHVVPLSRQVLTLLRELHAWTGDQEFIFQGARAGRPLCENTVNVALAVGVLGARCADTVCGRFLQHS